MCVRSHSFCRHRWRRAWGWSWLTSCCVHAMHFNIWEREKKAKTILSASFCLICKLLNRHNSRCCWCQMLSICSVHKWAVELKTSIISEYCPWNSCKVHLWCPNHVQSCPTVIEKQNESALMKWVLCDKVSMIKIHLISMTQVFISRIVKYRTTPLMGTYWYIFSFFFHKIHFQENSVYHWNIICYKFELKRNTHLHTKTIIYMRQKI